jgi:coproporphyrinogen III oxidase-like Fe-S oxidoreductase
MFSICELRLRRGEPSAGSHAANLRAWRALWARMHALGLKPIHIGQFGRDQRDNLYFTYPARNEACVALGPYAHGEFAGHWYQNLLLGAFERAVEDGRTPIREGLRFDARGAPFAAFEQALLTHCVDPALVCACLDADEEALLPLFRAWERAGYFAVDETTGALALTCEGSWFVGNMVHDLRDRTALEQEAAA